MVALIAAAAGIWARFYKLALPAKPIFDEVYFPVFATRYLSGLNVFDVHPPLGKFLIAGGIAVFGDHPFGWRVVPALFGVALIALAAAVWWFYRRDRIGALLFASFIALEPICIAYSRTGLLDGIQLFFILACFATACAITRPRQLIGLALLIGCAVSIKWVALGVVLPVAYVLWRKGLLKPFIPSLSLSLLVYLAIVFIGQVLNATPNPLHGVLEWHIQAFEYHLRLTATHPWSSTWYSWPFMTRPVLFLYDVGTDGRTSVMTAIGNPALWWLSTVAVAASIIEILSLSVLRQKVADHPLVPLLIGYAACLLPWIPIHRVVFMYHYLPSYSFAIMMTIYWIMRVWKRAPYVGLGIAVAILSVGVYFLPFAMGLPITDEVLKQHVWVHSWLYG